MQCANPDCGAPAGDLNSGVLRLIELEVPPEQRVIRSEGGFPVCAVPSRYFWLCPVCSSSLRIARWTPRGLTLERKAPGTATGSNEPLVIPFGPQRSHTSKTVTRKMA